MKKFFSQFRFIPALFLLGIFALGASFVLAQENPSEPPMLEISFEEQVQSLAAAIDRFAEILNADPENNPEEANQSATATGSSTTHTEYPYPNCMRNYTSWPKSYDRDETADWSMWKFKGNTSSTGSGGAYYLKKQLIDLNGDGLQDYLYNYNESKYLPSYGRASYNGKTIYYTQERSCVLLNTGSGWEEAYKCFATIEEVASGKWRPVYYGHCADI